MIDPEEVVIPDAVLAGCDLAGINARDLADVAMGAAAWAAGFSIAQNEHLPSFQATVNRVLSAFSLSCEFGPIENTK